MALRPHVQIVLFFILFFQAEDGIRDLTVTGVQTCALPILDDPRGRAAPLPLGHPPLLCPAASRREYISKTRIKNESRNVAFIIQLYKDFFEKKNFDQMDKHLSKDVAFNKISLSFVRL